MKNKDYDFIWFWDWRLRDEVYQNRKMTENEKYACDWLQLEGVECTHLYKKIIDLSPEDVMDLLINLLLEY